MRKPNYLSPTSLAMFYEHREDFYIQYISDFRRPRPPQTAPMAVGSAFDAYVKSFLVEKLIGKDPRFEFEKIFCDQVEEHNRDEAREAGKIVWENYQRLGALSDVLIDLQGCVGKPRFEAAIEGFVTGVSVTKGEVPFLGKPDIFFIAKQGARVIFDWKVNGYYANYSVSPGQGYVRIRSDNPKENGYAHRDAMRTPHRGLTISAVHPLDQVDKKWAAQLTVYAWLLGEDIGSQFVAAIDQIACGKKPGVGRFFRIAQHRSLITPDFQKDLFKKAVTAWKAIQDEHIFMELSKAESDEKCRQLDEMSQVPPDADFDALCR